MASANEPLVEPKHISRARRMNMKMVQNVLLIWLDASIDEENPNCQNTISQLREVVNTIETFTDGNECMQFLDEVPDEKMCLIISGSIGQYIVPCVQDMSQVDSIFIFCGDKQYHKKWAKDYSKVKGVYTRIQQICDALQQSVKDCEQNAIGFSLVATEGGLSDVNLDRLDPMFMYTQIIKEILLVIPFEQKHILDFTEYCRKMLEGNQRELSKVDTLERTYFNKTPIWWYTWESFLYSMLNRALRLSEIDVIVNMGFFIRDLHRQVDQLHNQQFCGSDANQQFTVYRGQGISREELEKISTTKGGLLAFNNFLSTSRSESISNRFAERAIRNSKFMGVLFEMKIHPERSTAPFASVAEVGAHADREDEILFAMHTVFRIRDIEQMDENRRLFRVKLELTSDNDRDLQMLMKRIREETSSDGEGWRRLGSVLCKLDKLKQAEEIYWILLEQEYDISEKAHLYSRLAQCKYGQAEYEKAIELYEESIAIYEKYASKSPNLAASYNSIGSVYDEMGAYAKALFYFSKLLEIRQQSLPHNHPELARSCNNIGNVSCNMGEYTRALFYFEKALTIRQQSLPPDHPDLAEFFINIGVVYGKMGKHTNALLYHEKALEIRQQSLSLNHPDLARCLINIGNVYCNIGEYDKALSHHQKALAIQQQSLPSNHSDLALPYVSIGKVYDEMGEYTEALSYHEKALAIRQQSLSRNHPELAKSCNNIGIVYGKMDKYTEALSYHQKALAILQQLVSFNHPELPRSCNNIGIAHSKMGEYAKALSYHEKALAIQRQSLPPNHPDLVISYRSIGNMYDRMNERDKALSYRQKALEFEQQLPSFSQHDLTTSHLDSPWFASVKEFFKQKLKLKK